MVQKPHLLWMVEGMIAWNDGENLETLRDVAESYLSELANRCMVQVKKDEEFAHNRFASCRLHDLVRDLSLKKGEEEGFLRVVNRQIGRQDTSSSSVRRLAFHLDKVEDYQFHECESLRSLLFLNKGWASIASNIDLVSINFGMFKSLKILILENYRFHNGQLPNGIEKLLLLKHLSIRNSEVDELPKSICKLPCLQSLDLKTYKGLRLPNSLHEISRLKHLNLSHYNRTIEGGAKLKLDGLNELETLIGFNSSFDDVVDLIKLPKLRVFQAVICDKESLSIIVDQILNHQDKFRETTISIEKEININSEIDGGSTSLLRSLLMCHSLSQFVMVSGRVGKLPSHESQMGMNLRMLLLDDCYISQDPMEILEKLPMLQSLTLDKAFFGVEMVCQANGFPELKELNLWNLPNLVEWTVEEKAMPNLSQLSMMSCRKLEKIPEGLKFITALKELSIWDMPEEFRIRVRVVGVLQGEDYHKIKHIPIVRVN